MWNTRTRTVRSRLRTGAIERRRLVGHFFLLLLPLRGLVPVFPSMAVTESITFFVRLTPNVKSTRTRTGT
jgi:hypothetical protein